MTVRRLAPGIVLGLALVGVVRFLSAGGSFPVRPLFDGLAPPSSYRWIDPPPEFAEQNVAPAGGTGRLELGEEGSVPGSISTRDGQATVVFVDGAFAPSNGASEVAVTISPGDPGEGAEPPAGLRFDGNAYTVRATYRPGGEAAALTGPASMVLRYPRHATVLLRSPAEGWRQLETQVIQASLQVVATTDALGTFVAAGPLDEGESFPWLLVVSAGAAVAAVVLGLRARRREAARAGAARARRPPTARPSPPRPSPAGPKARPAKKRPRKPRRR